MSSNAEALAVIKEAVANAGYKLGTDVTLALDCASSEFYKDGKYVLLAESPWTLRMVQESHPKIEFRYKSEE